MTRFAIALLSLRGLVALPIVSGCVGELTDEQKARAGGGSADGSNTGGAGGAGGASGAGGAGKGGLDLCVVPLMNKSCNVLGCHSASRPAGGLDLTEAAITQPASLVDKINAGDPTGCQASMFKLIDSREPEKSLIYRKLTPPAPCGASMPVGPALAATETACVLRWIKSIPGVAAGAASGGSGDADF
jgi:hypothetical protein